MIPSRKINNTKICTFSKSIKFYSKCSLILKKKDISDNLISLQYYYKIK